MKRRLQTFNHSCRGIFPRNVSLHWQSEPRQHLPPTHPDSADRRFLCSPLRCPYPPLAPRIEQSAPGQTSALTGSTKVYFTGVVNLGQMVTYGSELNTKKLGDFLLIEPKRIGLVEYLDSDHPRLGLIQNEFPFVRFFRFRHKTSSHPLSSTQHWFRSVFHMLHLSDSSCAT
jgi:hypothetical protein